MNKSLIFGALIGLSVPYLASAQCAPGQTPESILSGKTYAFRLAGRQTGAIGTFTASAGGYLAITETVTDASGAIPNSVMRTAPTSGRWMVGGDCASGMLLFNLNRANFQLNFTTSAANPSLLTITGQNTSNPNALASVQRFGPPDPAALSGIARQLTGPVTACGANPLNGLNGATFSYGLAGGGFAETGSFTGFLSSPFAYSGSLIVGVNVAGIPTPRTVSTAPPPPTSPTVLYSALGASGRYTIYGDCSGGEVLFNARGFAIQVEFVFSRTDGSEMFMIADDLSGSNLNYPYVGTGTRQ